MLPLLDILLTLVHLIIIGFNLTGWIWPATRKAHLICVAATLFSWAVLGIWFGFGYCPVTEWQWEVKRKLGETNLPGSFIKYYADKLSGKNFDPSLVNTLTAATFGLIIIVTIYVNFVRRKITHDQ
ncbi:MAG TPA: DUF2784 domain-containing protein [Flavisolibacter sp.]|nr:DUF2784 domain-containing protein [Flavisolibacter sp.]